MAGGECAGMSDARATGSVILVVDDSSTNRYLVKSMLVASGHQVEECDNGLQCIQYCKSHLPSMILMDIMMPELDGIETCKELRKSFSRDQLPIIMVTTKSDGTDIAEGLQAGANDYVTKPIDRAVLLARIENQFAILRAAQMVRQQQRELKAALRVQAAMGDVLPDGLTLHNEEGQILYQNRVAKVYCGDASIPNIESVIKGIFSGSLAHEAEFLMGEIADNPEIAIDEEMESPDGHGSFQVISRPIREQEGQQLRLWLWRDLTRTRELERKLKERAKLETVGLFASGVAHNFNNIMSVILGASELLKRWTEGDPRAEKCISSINQSIEVGSNFVKKLYAVAGSRESGQSESCDLAIVIERLARDMNLSSNAAIQLEISVPRDLPRIRIDSDSAEEIFTNLLSNAVDSLQASGKITLSAERRGNEEIEVRMIDTGRGMDAKTLQRIFEPFYSTKKLDQVHGVSLEGHGLGLWNVYYLLRLVGGDIEVKSAPGSGTAVLVRLPVSAA